MEMDDGHFILYRLSGPAVSTPGDSQPSGNRSHALKDFLKYTGKDFVLLNVWVMCLSTGTIRGFVGQNYLRQFTDLGQLHPRWIYRSSFRVIFC